MSVTGFAHTELFLVTLLVLIIGSIILTIVKLCTAFELQAELLREKNSAYSSWQKYVAVVLLQSQAPANQSS